MRKVSDLHAYQKKAIMFQCDKPHSMLWLDPGLGKTSITLNSISHLISKGVLKSVIVVAPKKVIQMVWKQESRKWENLQHLRFSTVTGTVDQRCRALCTKADIY